MNQRILKSNRMKNYFCKILFQPIQLAIFFICLISLKASNLNAEYLSEEFQIDSSTKKAEGGSVLPTNPFEIVEMIRRNNAMRDATNPSDAIDDALESFKSFEENQEI